MKKLFSHITKKEIQGFLKFFMTGLFGALVNFLSQIPLKTLFLNFGMNSDAAFAWSVFWAYMFSTAVSFIPAKIWAFSAKSTGNTRREWLKFFIIATLALGVQEIVSILVRNQVANVYFTEYSEFIRDKGSHLAGMACSFVANFLGHRFFTFRSTGIYDKIRPQQS
ncbi:GtrA family protein [Jiulongibacter sp. NS-SX5]|uniref:GtrA family protein n=1 Tax=Jiulongibacter sp. NS-SX5 TaxID=3463854 RepID=UPI0040590CF6